MALSEDDLESSESESNRPSSERRFSCVKKPSKVGLEDDMRLSRFDGAACHVSVCLARNAAVIEFCLCIVSVIELEASIDAVPEKLRRGPVRDCDVR